jgi:aryl-alcohol dehydrogenase-like predicted oxidoreductase
LGGGLLAGKNEIKKGTRSSDVWDEYSMTEDRIPQFEAYSEVCKALGEPEHVVAIAWTLAHPAVDSAIVGVRTLRHLDGLDRASSLELDEETMARLNEIFNINRGRPLKNNAPAPQAYAW